MNCWQSSVAVYDAHSLNGRFSLGSLVFTATMNGGREMLRLCCCLCVALLSLSVSAQSNVSVGWDDIVVLSEDYPPLNYLDEGVEQGSSVEILRRVYQQMGLDGPSIQWVPWQRAYGLVQSQRPVMVLTMTRTDTREPLFQWAGPTHVARHLLVRARDFPVEYDNDPLRSQSMAIVAVRNDVSSVLLREAGYPEHLIAEVDTFRAALNLLVNDRMPLASVPENGFRAFLQQMDLAPEQFEVVQVLSERSGYFAFSHAVPSHLVAEFQAALDDIREEQLTILEKYGLGL